MGFEITTHITLKGESSCWFFSRSNETFNTTTAIIKISKEDKSQKLFISLGTFVKDYLDQEVFKVFLKQQLIDNSSKFICFTQRNQKQVLLRR